MTAQSSGSGSDAECDPRGRPQLVLAERNITPDTAARPSRGTVRNTARNATAGTPEGTAVDTALDAFLHGVPQAWGGPTGSAESGFAALRFDATPGSVTRTRSFLRSTLTGWQLPDLVDDATAIAAELVANAVTHALQPAAAPLLPPKPSAWIALVRTDHAVVCAVADPSPALPAMAEPEPFAESGRGLRIVAELSETWGHSPPEAAGKTVWARLASGR
ncbi:ATP-binding protein [Actinacidiphila rubida]|uniref:Anti-sigma regulatory factor (Ser/Thr protein kinase) n=1 Tax=Actinacidiphila rubida TaxID=310780 RepID=A0A1H8J2K5_9ACTN|nr:ATP-binding protein [Actinacidiphila rubida]SEN74901.1 Anti-sigma regulatory factor (Ser/Thr protein kinase) [Actinacidiphila rubida]